MSRSDGCAGFGAGPGAVAGRAGAAGAIEKKSKGSAWAAGAAPLGVVAGTGAGAGAGGASAAAAAACLSAWPRGADGSPSAEAAGDCEFAAFDGEKDASPPKRLSNAPTAFSARAAISSDVKGSVGAFAVDGTEPKRSGGA